MKLSYQQLVELLKHKDILINQLLSLLKTHVKHLKCN